jgi:hypothetical protein
MKCYDLKNELRGPLQTFQKGMLQALAHKNSDFSLILIPHIHLVPHLHIPNERSIMLPQSTWPA